MEGEGHQEKSAVEEHPCDKNNNNQIGEAELKKIPESEEKEETENEKEKKTECDGEGSTCTEEKEQLQTESQEDKDDCKQEREGAEGAETLNEDNIAEGEAGDNTDCKKETKEETEKQTQEAKKEEDKPSNKEDALNKSETKKTTKGKDAEVKSEVKKKGKTEEGEKAAKTQRRPGVSSSSLAALSRPRVSARSSRASNKKDLIAKFQQGAPETPVGRNFKIQRSATAGATGASIKQKMLQWCISKTRKYEGVNIENFSSSWCDGMAFCALIHRFFPDAFDFASLDPKEREKNFTLAFQTAETLADCYPLLEVPDMLLMGNHPDPMCVFTYVQSLCHSLSKIEKQRKEKEEKEKAEKKEGQEPNKETEEPEETEETEVDSGTTEDTDESQVNIPNNEEICDEEDASTRTETDGEPLVEKVS